VNPGGKHYRFADTPQIRKWCDSKKAERERPRIRRSTAGKAQRRRYGKIERLIDIFVEERPVEKTDKQLALRYFNALAKLAFQRIQPLTHFPLLEGVRALDQGTYLFRFTRGTFDQPLGVNLFRGLMEALPIRPEA